MIDHNNTRSRHDVTTRCVKLPGLDFPGGVTSRRAVRYLLNLPCHHGDRRRSRNLLQVDVELIELASVVTLKAERCSYCDPEQPGPVRSGSPCDGTSSPVLNLPALDLVLLQVTGRFWFSYNNKTISVECFGVLIN